MHRASTHKDPTGFDSAADATLALASLAEDTLELDDDYVDNRDTDRPLNGRPDAVATRRSDSRATSTISKASSNPRDLPAGSAEVVMFAREYHGYWRPSFAGAVPACAAICGTMLLTARLPAQTSAKIVSADPDLRDEARSLQQTLNAAASSEEAMQELHEHSLEAVIVALRSSLDAANLPMVPERPA